MSARPGWFATNARALLDARRQGFATEDPVVVSLIGPNFPLRTLLVRPEQPVDRFDWLMLVNLEVWICANATEPLDRVRNLVTAIAAVKPRRLYLRFHDDQGLVHDVDIGTGSHRAAMPEYGIKAEHEFVFCPINAAGTRLGRRLTDALRQHNPGDRT